MNTLSDRINDAMAEKACTAAELAKAAGVKEPSVSDWRSKETKSLKAETALKAAAFLGVSPFWLVLGVGPKRPSEIERFAAEHGAYIANQDRALYKAPLAGAILPKSKRQRLSEKISAALEGINEDGLLVALGRIQTLADEYPRAAKQTPSS